MALTLDGDNGVSGVNGSAGTPALQGTDTNTGISFGTDTVNLVTGGSNRFVVGSAGQLGIGGATYGTSGQVLTSAGSGAAPTWATSVDTNKVFAHQSFDSNQSLNPNGYNVSSVTNNATGKNTVNFTTSHGNTQYSVLCSGCRFLAGTDSMSISYGNMAAGSVEIFSAGPVGTYLNLGDTSVCILT